MHPSLTSLEATLIETMIGKLDDRESGNSPGNSYPIALMQWNLHLAVNDENRRNTRALRTDFVDLLAGYRPEDVGSRCGDRSA